MYYTCTYTCIAIHCVSRVPYSTRVYSVLICTHVIHVYGSCYRINTRVRTRVRVYPCVHVYCNTTRVHGVLQYRYYYNNTNSAIYIACHHVALRWRRNASPKIYSTFLVVVQIITVPSVPTGRPGSGAS